MPAMKIPITKGLAMSESKSPKAYFIPSASLESNVLSVLDTTVSVGVEQPQVLPVLIVSGLLDLIWQACCSISTGSFFWLK